MGQIFGQKLRYLRTRSQLTQVELAQQLQLASHAHVSNLEAGRFEPSLEMIVAVAEIFAVRVEYLILDRLPADAAEEHQREGSASARSAHYFGPRLAQLRIEAGNTQAQLADQLLAAQAHISFLESGKKLPSVDLLLRVADLFGVPVDALLSPK
ncbi:helix-turn-helix domain-containing protein [Oscillochloris sp. ZM17-4]|uniref:helix-turn-helix transcriptional regulator n=1 Tax=Oscillochloris sp. ZM17-4 TaxID=2866714 RepID=UPI001C730096|nr:helix-turn-helix transcriptional regulator [Oscillochloris sp. ZM17-4]MBX0329001.1 helix-turn-helix domain-containing protein [Oscillochloris sp. ZM17-4]